MVLPCKCDAALKGRRAIQITINNEFGAPRAGAITIAHESYSITIEEDGDKRSASVTLRRDKTEVRYIRVPLYEWGDVGKQ